TDVWRNNSYSNGHGLARSMSKIDRRSVRTLRLEASPRRNAPLETRLWSISSDLALHGLANRYFLRSALNAQSRWNTILLAPFFFFRIVGAAPWTIACLRTICIPINNVAGRESQSNAILVINETRLV